MLYLRCGLLLFFLACQSGGDLGAGSSTSEVAASSGAGTEAATTASPRESESSGSSTTGFEPAWTLPPLALDWERCTTAGISPGAECARASVPAFYEDPSFGDIQVEVMRYPGTQPGQLWMLAGGPGEPGSIYAQDHLLQRFTATGLDVYLLTHRGVGRSTQLQCDFMGTGDDALATCASDLENRYGGVQGLAAFQSAEAARDLAAFIQAASDGSKVYLWGQSYGTYWAQRFLQEFSSMVDAVVLDGVLGLQDPLGMRPLLMHEVGLDVMRACGTDPACSAHFAPQTPVEALSQVISRLQENPCGTALDVTRQILRWAFFSVIEANQGRVLVPAIVHRLQRCNDDDVEALTFMVYALEARGLSEMLDAEAFLFNVPALSQIYFTHALTRDLPGNWESLREDINGQWDDLWFDPMVLADLVVRARAVWPEMERTNPSLDLPNELPPMLVVSGGWDVRTPLAWGEHLAEETGATQVVFPQAGHVLLDDTPTDTGDISCAQRVVHAFLADPSGPPRVDCLGDLQGEDFSGSSSRTAALANVVLGTTDVWGTGMRPAPATDAVTLRAVKRMTEPLANLLAL